MLALSPCEVTRRSASQEILCILCNTFFQYHVHKSKPLVSILCQMNTVHNLTPFFFKIYFNIILPPMRRSPDSFYKELERIYDQFRSTIWKIKI
jgi:hypothetical protein